MYSIFFKASNFTGDISKWDVARVTDMNEMFAYASSFNGDLSKWDVSKTYTMRYMFYFAKSFAQTLCGAWKEPKAVETEMFAGSSGKLC